jgi:hypothetical protein
MEEPSCRFCFESEGTLISPCPCKGSVQFIHLECQQRSYFINRSLECSICKKPYTNVQKACIETIPNIDFCAEMMFIYINFIFFIHLMPLMFKIFYSEITYENFIDYQIKWQMSTLLTLLLLNLLGFVKHRYRYLSMLIVQSPFSYTYLQLYIWIFLMKNIEISRSFFYILILYSSHFCMCFHFRIHTKILMKINETNVPFVQS